MANGIVHALKWLQTAGPGDIIKAVPDTDLLGDRSLGRFEPSVTPEKIALTRTFTNDYARRAKAKFLN
jgi:NitT/TauT family transport system substrate-binding protein